MPRKSEQDRCFVESCDSPFYAKTFCRHHYERAKRYGDPLGEPKIKKGDDKFDEDGNRWCSRCREYRDPSLFEKRHPRWCRPCKRAGKYGITRAEMEALPGYGGKCALCRKRRAAHIDHDHNCCSGRTACGKCVRGVICRECNTALGTIGEENIMNAMEYLSGGKRL